MNRVPSGRTYSRLSPFPSPMAPPSRYVPASCGSEFPGRAPTQSQTPKVAPPPPPQELTGVNTGHDPRRLLRSGCCGARGRRRAGRGAINRMSAERAAVSGAALPQLQAAPPPGNPRPGRPGRPGRSAAPLRAPSHGPRAGHGRLHLPTGTLTTSVCAGPRGSLAQGRSGSGVWLATRPAVRGPAWTPAAKERHGEDERGWARTPRRVSGCRLLRGCGGLRSKNAPAPRPSNS